MGNAEYMGIIMIIIIMMVLTIYKSKCRVIFHVQSRHIQLWHSEKLAHPCFTVASYRKMQGRITIKKFLQVMVRLTFQKKLQHIKATSFCSDVNRKRPMV